MAKQVIVTDKAAGSSGPISQAVRVGELVFTAGAVGALPSTGKLVRPGLEAEARQALDNLRHVLDAAGSCLDCVAKVTVYLTDIGDRPVFNQIYREYFPQEYPARTAVQVVALAGGARVEVEAVAAVCDHG